MVIRCTFFARVLPLLAAVLLWGGAYAHARTITLGMSAAFTGPSRGLGIELYRGAMCYFESVNARGGVNGNRIEIIPYDDGYNPFPTLRNTVRFIEQYDVFALFNYVGTPTVTRILPLLRKYSDKKIYLLFPFTGAEPHRRAPYFDYVFNLRASYHEETTALVDRFVSLGRERIAVFYQADAYGRGGWDGVRRALKRYDLSIVSEASYHRGAEASESFTAQAELIAKGAPDAVVCIGAYSACAGFIRDLRNLGVDQPVATISFVDSDNLISLLAELTDTTGRDYSRNLLHSQVVPGYADERLPAVREYRALMDVYDSRLPVTLVTEEYTPKRYSTVSFEGYLNARLFVEILKRMGPEPERDRIHEAMESLGTIDLGIGEPVHFGSKRHQGLQHVYFTTVDDFQQIPVTDWERWRK